MVPPRNIKTSHSSDIAVFPRFGSIYSQDHRNFALEKNAKILIFKLFLSFTILDDIIKGPFKLNTSRHYEDP